MSGQRTSRSTIFAANLVTLLLVLGTAFTLYFAGTAAYSAIRGKGYDVTVHEKLDIGGVAGGLDSLPPNTVTDEVPISFVFRDASPEQVWYSVGRDIAPALLILAILWVLRRLLNSVREGDPFNTPNVRRLRTVGLILLVGAPIAELVRSGFEQALASSTIGAGSGLSFSVPGGALIAGLGVFVLAQVFAEGVRLREDVERTV